MQKSQPAPDACLHGRCTNEIEHPSRETPPAPMGADPAKVLEWAETLRDADPGSIPGVSIPVPVGSYRSSRSGRCTQPPCDGPAAVSRRGVAPRPPGGRPGAARRDARAGDPRRRPARQPRSGDRRSADIAGAPPRGRGQSGVLGGPLPLRRGDVLAAMASARGTQSRTSVSLGSGRAARPGTPLRQLDLVERHVERSGVRATVVRSPRELDRALGAGVLAVAHCVEGAFHLGPDPARIDAAVAGLKRRGVAYLTLGHLWFKDVANVAPSWATVGQEWWEQLWPQPPRSGLAPLGRAAAEACVHHRVPLDVRHLSERSLTDLWELLDALDPERALPVIASHAAVRRDGLQYALSAEHHQPDSRARRNHRPDLGRPPARPDRPPGSLAETAALLAEHVRAIERIGRGPAGTRRWIRPWRLRHTGRRPRERRTPRRLAPGARRRTR